MLLLGASQSDAIGEEFEMDVALPWTIELGEENALPTAKSEFTLLDEDKDVRTHKHGFHVGVRVAFRVAVGSARRNESIQGGFGIRSHVGVGMFIDKNARCCVRHIEQTGPAPDGEGRDDKLNLMGDVDHLGAAISFDADRLHHLLPFPVRTIDSQEIGTMK
jgi:hypothetical protein